MLVNSVFSNSKRGVIGIGSARVPFGSIHNSSTLPTNGANKIISFPSFVPC